MSKCTACGDKPENTAKDFTKAVIEINNPETLVLLRKVVIPASMGDDTDVVPAVGKYRNVILQYEANGHIYLYSSDGIPTAIEANIPQEVLDQIAELENDVDSLERADEELQREIDDLKNSPDVVDIVATYADLQAYDTSTLGDKDVIRVLEDETHNNESAYYRWDKTNSQWVFIGAVEGYYTKDQTDDLLDAKQDLLTPGENITIEDESGALVISATDTKYTAGSNVQISSQNVISATDTTYTHFTGTDGTTAGAAGLVPAPATTDAGKFLSASGLWEAVQGGGGVTELTSADYNWPTDNPTGVALWLLDSGWYTAPGITVFFDVAKAYGTFSNGGELFYVSKSPTANVSRIAVIGKDNTVTVYSTQLNSGSEYSSPTKTVSVVQSTGTSKTSVMSQNAVTSMVFADPSIQRIVRIGNANTSGSQSVSIGVGAGASVNESIAIGANAMANGPATLALGSSSTATQAGEISFPYCRSGGASGVVNFGPYNASFGYNNSKYRLLTGVYDGQNAHDAATYGQVISYSAINGAGAPTAATEGKYVGQLYYDTTNEAMYFLKAIDTTTDPDTYTWEALGGGSSVNVVQTTGTSTTDVMSQNATTSMVFADPADKYKVQIGSGANCLGYGVAIGSGATVGSSISRALSLGSSANATANDSIALGSASYASQKGEMNIGNNQGNGYNDSQYRLLTGLYDPQSDHDAATKGYVDTSLLGKQDALTAGDNITIQDESGDLVISATDTTYTAGAGLNLVGTQFAVDTTTIATQTDLAGKLDDSTTFWGRTANNGVVDGGITISSADGLPGMYIGYGQIDINKPAAFYLRARKDSSTYSNVLWWNSASNNVPSNVHLDAAGTKMTLLTNEVRLGGRYSSDNVKISNVATPQSAQDAATKGYVDPSTGTSAPTTSTTGRLGEVRIDTSTNTAYMCVSADSTTSTFIWKQITA